MRGEGYASNTEAQPEMLGAENDDSGEDSFFNYYYLNLSVLLF